MIYVCWLMNSRRMRLDNLKKIVADVLDLPVNEITNETSPETTESWDSFNHLLLISVIEQKLGVKFVMEEVFKIKSYAILEDLVRKKDKQGDV